MPKDIRNIITVVSLIIIIPLIQFSLLRDQLKFGFSTDDVMSIAEFNLLGDNPYSKLGYAWFLFGVHYTPAIYYTGSLASIFGLNHQSYYLFAQIFKIISTLTLYPLVLILICLNVWSIYNSYWTYSECHITTSNDCSSLVAWYYHFGWSTAFFIPLSVFGNLIFFMASV